MNPSPPRLPRPLFHLIVAALLCCPFAGSAQESNEISPPDSTAQPAVARDAANPGLPKLELTPKLLYQLLLAEIAGQRGNIPLAQSLYLDLARSTRDPRVARRAAEISLHARQLDSALEAARIWVQADPESSQGRQMLAGLLLGKQNLEEAVPHLAKWLAIEIARPAPAEGEETRRVENPQAAKSFSGNLGHVLDYLYRLLARFPDKATELRLMEQLTAPYQNFPEAHYVRAQAASDAKDDARALASLERALELRPDWEAAVLFKVHLQQRISSTLATETLRRFLDDHPKADEVRIAYARTLIGDKRYEEAHREFEALLNAHPDNGEVLYAVALLSMQLRDLEPAEKHMKKLLEMRYGDLNLLHFYLGQIAEDSKRPQDALQWYGLIKSGDQYLPALSRAAALLAKQGRIDEGRMLLKKAAEDTPNERVQILLAESQLLSSVGRNVEAFDLLDKQLAKEPEQPELLYESALLAEKIDRLDVLERNLRKLILLKPEDAHAYNALGYSLADHGLRLDEAQQLIDKGLALAPDDAFILDSKGWLFYRRGENGAAIEFLKKAFSLREDPEIAAHLGEVLWITGRRDEALKTWNDSAKANPNNALLADTIKKFKQ